VTVIERMVRAGIAEERAQRYLRAGAVMVDGERVTDGEMVADPPSRIVLQPD
jgi:16S rRNA U516 pseudouridylate synthase RsuA-like enzyme